jgi:hypothetical protein
METTFAVPTLKISHSQSKPKTIPQKFDKT